VIYFLRHVQTGLIKIGYTKQFMKRIANLIGRFGEIEVLGLMDGNLKDEGRVQCRFYHLNCKKLDYWFSGYWGDEWFVCEQDLLDYIAANTSMNFPLPFAGEIDSRSASIRVDIDRLNALARTKKRSSPPNLTSADYMEKKFPGRSKSQLLILEQPSGEVIVKRKQPA